MSRSKTTGVIHNTQVDRGKQVGSDALDGKPKLRTGTLGRGGSNPAGRSGEADGIACKHGVRGREKSDFKIFPTRDENVCRPENPHISRFGNHAPPRLPLSPLSFPPSSPSRRGIRAGIPFPLSPCTEQSDRPRARRRPRSRVLFRWLGESVAAEKARSRGSRPPASLSVGVSSERLCRMVATTRDRGRLSLVSRSRRRAGARTAWAFLIGRAGYSSWLTIVGVSVGPPSQWPQAAGRLDRCSCPNEGICLPPSLERPPGGQGAPVGFPKPRKKALSSHWSHWCPLSHSAVTAGRQQALPIDC